MVVDTSALMAVLLGEAQADACSEALAANDRLLISAVTVAEALIVGAARNLGDEMERFVAGLGFEVASVTPAATRRAAAASRTWGKGIHPAGLNFGDCFAYALAIEHGCPLLFVGDNFARTDVLRVLGG